MADNRQRPVENTSDREIVTTRIVSAPRELVFKAFSDPNHLVHWWGPKGFTNTFHEFDMRPGGIWRFVMYGPNGASYQNESVFVEVVKPERILFQHLKPVHRFHMTMTFAEQAGKTKLTWRMLFESAAECAKVKRFVSEANEQNFDRLEAQLAKMSGEGEFVITRDFDAPRALVWKAWTDPKRMARWWGPHGFTNPVCELDLRPGGAHRIVMRSSEGVDYPIKGVYREVVKPERLVMTLDCSEHPADWHHFLDEQLGQKEGRNPAGEMIQTAIFEDLGSQTKLTIRTRFLSAALRDAMVKMGMTEGWSQSLDRLAEVLAKA